MLEPLSKSPQLRGWDESGVQGIPAQCEDESRALVAAVVVAVTVNDGCGYGYGWSIPA